MSLRCKHFFYFQIRHIRITSKHDVYTVNIIALLVWLLFSPFVAAAAPCDRIISLAPSITQTLSALGLTDNIVAVSAFETTPPAVKKLPVISFGADGGLNVEAVLAFEPDTVFTVRWHNSSLNALRKLGITILEADSSTLDAYFAAVSAIAAHCNRSPAGQALITRLRRGIGLDKPKPATSPDTLLVTGSAVGFPVYAAGIPTIYSAVMEYAGCGNVLRKQQKVKLPDYPPLSREGLIALAPTRIIILAPSGEKAQLAHRRKLFADLPLPAVQSGNIHIFAHPNALIPGPALPQTAKALQQWCSS